MLNIFSPKELKHVMEFIMRNGTDFNIIVSIPPEAHRCSDGRVYVVLEKRYFKDLRYNKDSRAWLGKAISDTQMHPNNTYKLLYPEELKSVPHINLPTYVKRVGMYAAALAIGERSGLYEDLVTCFGPRSANLIMDYATYSIVTESNVMKDFATEMADRMLFLGNVYSDSWIEDQFNNTINDNQIQAFKNAWMKRFTSEELSNVWLSIDESEHGIAKSNRDIEIISFLYAVTESGIPVTSQIYRGSRVDRQAVKEMVTIMNGYDIKPKGFILDRAFCNAECIRLFQGENLDFVIMMKENTNGFQTLLERYQNKIRLKWNYAIGNGLFGTSDHVSVFKNDNLELDAAVIWDSKNGLDRINYLVDGLFDVIENARIEIQKGKNPIIPDKYKNYVRVVTKENSVELVVLDDVIQAEIEENGYYGLVTSKKMSAKEADAVYDLRDCSEKQYSVMKTQLGNSVFRAHNMHKIAVREMIAFVASVIRHEIMAKCREAKLLIDTNTAIKELNLINMNLIGNNRYQVIHNQSKLQKEIMSLLGITPENLDHIAAYETDRLNRRTVHPVQSLSANKKPNMVNESRNSGRGRPKGSKNKSKVVDQELVAKRKPGRPKGSKNKPKVAEPVIKRKPGRPKGSKNKTKL